MATLQRLRDYPVDNASRLPYNTHQVYNWKSFFAYFFFFNRLEDQETSLVQQYSKLSEKWHEGMKETRDWCQDAQAKLESLEISADTSNYEELCEHQKDLQVCTA